MAILIPDIEVAKALKQKPTQGEIFLLEFLAGHFNDEAEVYFQPCFNGDRPDVVVMDKKRGIIILEVKDWNLQSYSIDSRNKWSLKSNQQRIKSPFQQAFAYKKNFRDFHINGLLEKCLDNENYYRTIKTYVYFHGSTKHEISSLYQVHLKTLNELSANNEEEFFKRKAISWDTYEATRLQIQQKKFKFERDLSLALYRDKLSKISFPLAGNSILFEDGVYSEFKRLLNPPYHYASEGKPVPYSEKQLKLMASSETTRSKIRGLAGSGKTVVLAGRAVNAHKRHGDRVLILTFNITLCSYIHDKISAVREEFPWKEFDINNYHRFITIALNNSGIDIEIPEELQYDGHDLCTARSVAKKRDMFLEQTYYSNEKIFHSEEIDTKYKTILIDEIQDYKPEWIKIVRSAFLEEGGEMILFGDEKQNIYGRPLEGRRSKVVEGFGEWKVLTRSFRYKDKSPMIPLVDAFQKAFMGNTYEVDIDESFQLSLTHVGIHACGVYDKDHLDRVASQIIQIAKTSMTHPNNISIISSQEGALRNLDYSFRTSAAHKERTLCTFPSLEVTNHPKYSKHYQEISASKKKGFNLNSGVMKLSSTHSFKGFESPFIVLLIHDKDNPEMVLTGLTRAKENIVVYVEKDSPFLNFFKSHLDDVNATVDSHSALAARR